MMRLIITRTSFVHHAERTNRQENSSTYRQTGDRSPGNQGIWRETKRLCHGRIISDAGSTNAIQNVGKDARRRKRKSLIAIRRDAVRT